MNKYLRLLIWIGKIVESNDKLILKSCIYILIVVIK